MIGLIGIMLVSLCASGSCVTTLAPIIVVFVLIVAAAGISRGGDVFSLFGIGALLGITQGVGKGGIGKGLRSGTASGRRTMKGKLPGRLKQSGLKAKATKAGKARRAARIEKKQTKLVGKLGAAAGNRAQEDKIIAKLGKLEGQKNKLGGGIGLVNRAVNTTSGRIGGLRTTRNENIAKGFDVLSARGAGPTGLTAAAAAGVTAAEARGRAARTGIGGWFAGRQIIAANKQQKSMTNLLSNTNYRAEFDRQVNRGGRAFNPYSKAPGTVVPTFGEKLQATYFSKQALHSFTGYKGMKAGYSTLVPSAAAKPPKPITPLPIDIAYLSPNLHDLYLELSKNERYAQDLRARSKDRLAAFIENANTLTKAALDAERDKELKKEALGRAWSHRVHASYK